MPSWTRGGWALLSLVFACPWLQATDTTTPAHNPTTKQPNIVVILADDLGYGDVRAFHPNGKIATPHLDKLAAQGMIFTDAHSGSAVCTPTRYGLLTGRYCWRTPLQSGVLWGYSPRLIEPGRATIAELLRAQGYHTTCIGKWHLGMDWPLQSGGIAQTEKDIRKIDYTKKIANGPTTVGFDSFYGITGSLDMPPFIWIENDHTVGVPTVDKKLVRIGFAHKDFEGVDVLPTIRRKAVATITERAQAKDGKPFFLYLPLNAPHAPILPAADWQGKSGLNAYADFVMQTDAVVGDVLHTLDQNHCADNTLVIFTSDNGCSPQAKFAELLAKKHNPNAHFRGHKADIYEGGHRVPFLVRWPGVVKPGTSCAQLACLTDIFRTVAEAAKVPVPDRAGEDSVSLVPLLRHPEGAAVRESVIHHSINGSFAIRTPRWKLIFCPGSGGWSFPRPGRDDTSTLPSVQLFDMVADVREKQNVAADHPEIVQQLTQLLEKQIADGRSTPGQPSPNTTPVDYLRASREAQRPLKKK
ncbi:MAG: arylsulfatase [Bacteroidales bacterium]|nr:arylsulfatase [Bacteroidales bacterium]